MMADSEMKSSTSQSDGDPDLQIKIHGSSALRVVIKILRILVPCNYN